MSLAPLLSVDLDNEPALRAARTLLLHAWLTRPQDIDLNRAAARVYAALDNAYPVPPEHAEPFIRRASLPVIGSVRTLGPRVLARLCRLPEHKARWIIQSRPADTSAFASVADACNACNALPLRLAPIQTVQDAAARAFTTSGSTPVTLDVAVTFEHLLFCFGDMRPDQITPQMTLALRTLAQAIGSPTLTTLRAYAEQYDTGQPKDAIDTQLHVEIRRRLGLHLIRSVGGRQPQHVPRVVLRRFFEGLTEGLRLAEAARRANNEHATDWPAYMFNNRHSQLTKAMRFSLPGELTTYARANPTHFMIAVDRWLDALDSRYFAVTAAERHIAMTEPGAEAVQDDHAAAFEDKAGLRTDTAALADLEVPRDSDAGDPMPIDPQEPEYADFEELDGPGDDPDEIADQ